MSRSSREDLEEHVYYGRITEFDETHLLLRLRHRRDWIYWVVPRSDCACKIKKGKMIIYTLFSFDGVCGQRVSSDKRFTAASRYGPRDS